MFVISSYASLFKVLKQYLSTVDLPQTKPEIEEALQTAGISYEESHLSLALKELIRGRFINKVPSADSGVGRPVYLRTDKLPKGRLPFEMQKQSPVEAVAPERELPFDDMPPVPDAHLSQLTKRERKALAVFAFYWRQDWRNRLVVRMYFGDPVPPFALIVLAKHGVNWIYGVPEREIIAEQRALRLRRW